MKSLDELFGDFEKERLAEIAKDETPEAIARREAKRAAEIEREKRQGLRDEDGNWIFPEESDSEDDDDEEESD